MPASIVHPNTIRDRYTHREKYWDAVARFDSSIANSTGFLNYDLSVHGLLAPGTSNGSKQINRVLLQKRRADYLLGIELELEGLDCDSPSERRASVSRILHQYLPHNHVCVPDGSIRSGFELVTAPLAPTEINRSTWHRLLNALDRAGLTSHQSGRCGLHISVSRGYLDEDTWEALRRFLCRKKAFFRQLSRRDLNADSAFHYCQFVTRTTKYTALNLSKTAVAEFRFFRGTLKARSFLASLEIVRALVEHARDLKQAGERVKFSARKFRAAVESGKYPIAAAYCAPHWPLLAEQRGGGSPRPRLSADARAALARAEFERFHPYGWAWCWETRGSAVQVINRTPFAETLPQLSYSPAPVRIAYQIDWDASLRYAPQRIQRLFRDRSRLPTELVIISKYCTPSSAARVVFDYRRGYFGNRSGWRLAIEPAN